MDGVKLLKSPRLKNPTLIVAWPGMGEVAFKAAQHLVESLKAEEVAEIAPDEFFLSYWKRYRRIIIKTSRASLQ